MSENQVCSQCHLYIYCSDRITKLVSQTERNQKVNEIDVYQFKNESCNTLNLANIKIWRYVDCSFSQGFITSSIMLFSDITIIHITFTEFVWKYATQMDRIYLTKITHFTFCESLNNYPKSVVFVKKIRRHQGNWKASLLVS